MTNASTRPPTPPHQHYLGGEVLGGRVCASPECWGAVMMGLVAVIDREHTDG